MIDWATIRTQNEAGHSQKSLAAKYGVSQQAISKRALKEGWVVSPQPPVVEDTTTTTSEEQESDAHILALARRMIAQRLNEEPDNKELKMLMDSFTQVKKNELLSPIAPSSQSSYIAPDLIAVMTPQEQDIVQKILSEAEQRLKQDEKVTPMRRTG